MKKLVELLNEYRRIDFVPERQEGVLMVAEEKVISKKFGFIQWLVDNDKIDYQKSPGEIMFDDRMGTMFSLEDSITMMLSISDTPIEDLISYLK